MPSSTPSTRLHPPAHRGAWTGVVFAFLLAACATHDKKGDDAHAQARAALTARSDAIRAQIGDDPEAALRDAHALLVETRALPDSTLQQLAQRTLVRVMLSVGMRDSSRMLAVASLHDARKRGEPRALADALILHAVVLTMEGTTDSSAVLLEEAIGHALQAGDSTLLAAAHGNLANAYSNLGDIRHAIEHYLTARDTYERLGIEGPLANSHRNLASEYATLGDHPRAISSFHEAVALYEKNARRLDLAYTLADLADVLRQAGDTAATRAVLQRSDSLARVLGDTTLLARNDYTRAEMLLHADDLDAARAYSTQSRRLFQARGNDYGEMLGVLLDARIEERDGNATRLLTALRRAYELASRQQLHPTRADLLRRMADVHARRGDGMQAHAALRAAVTITDSLNANLRTDAVHHVETEFQLERRRLENEQLHLENSLAHARIAQERMGVVAAAVIVVLLLTLLLLVWRSRQMKARALALSEEQRRIIEETSRQLEEANSLRQLLLDIVTHDVLNPFTAIQSAAEVLKLRPDNPRMLDIIHTSSIQGAAIVRNTAVLSRIALEGDVPKSDIVLADMLREVRQGFEEALREADMEFDIEIADDVHIEAWPVLIEVFRNFTENAIRYARDGRRIHVEAHIEDDATTIRFSDYGTTIPEHQRSSIFERRTRLQTHG